MKDSFKALITAADTTALESIRMFLPIYLVSAEQDARQQRRRAAAADITARLIRNDLQEAIALILYRVKSPESLLKNDLTRMQYAGYAAEEALKSTQDDFGRAEIKGLRAALKSILAIYRITNKYHKGSETENLTYIVGIAQDALRGVYPAELDLNV